jgi:hypothetical protein
VYLPFNSLSQRDFENYMNANKQRSCPSGQIRMQGALSSKFNGGFQHDGTNQCSNPHKLISSSCATSFVCSKRWKMLDYQSPTCASFVCLKRWKMLDYQSPTCASFVRLKRWKMLDYQSSTCAHSAFVRGYLADYLCTSIYFHSTFVPNMLDSSS